MRVSGWVGLPLVVGGTAVLTVAPRSAPYFWMEGSFAWILAPFLLGASALLGLIFRQFRISLMALILCAVIWGGKLFPSDTPSGTVWAYLASLSVPLAAILFLIIPEQRIFSQWGFARFCMAIFFAGMLLMVPELDRVQTWFTGHPMPSTVPTFTVPIITLFALSGLLAAALILTRPESPNVGRFFFALSLHVVALVNTGAIAEMTGLPPRELRQALSMACSALLAWLSVDCGWRNAFIDELTQLPGRRPMRHHFASLGEEFTLASVDIDHFKDVNDRYGHDVGDQVLRSIAAQLRGFRQGTAYRSGGEEFVIVMKRGELKEQARMLDDLRERISSRPFILRGRDRPQKKPSNKKASPSRGNANEIRITVSIGAANSEETDVPDEVLTTADKALYRAKRGGRNKVCTG